MVQVILIGVWTCLATLAGMYGGFSYRILAAHTVTQTHASKTNSRDLKTITVPVIKNGQISGYITADFSIVSQTLEGHDHTPDIDGYVLDEAYRLIYAETDLDFEFIHKTDLNRLTAAIRSHVNGRMKQDTLQDVLVRGFHYVPRDQIH